MKGNFHVRFGEGSGETRRLQSRKVRSTPTLRSGSFLIGAYQYLLDWHLSQYSQEPEKWLKGRTPTIFDSGKAGLRLTIGERKRILLAHIYGVDIDQQAVEVTKLSLLLKVLEGENEQTLTPQMRLLPERVLPDLSRNIKCGNSLIGPDYYDGVQQLTLGLVDEEELYRVNAFDWPTAFPTIMQAGGFEVVIGNPPYIQSRSGLLDEEEKKYYLRNYSTAQYQLNTYGLFVEQSIGLIKDAGLLGVIIPNYWLSTDADSRLRQQVFINNHVLEVVNVYRVFANATVDTLLLFAKRTNHGQFPKQCNIRAIERGLKTIFERLWAVANENWAFEQTLTIESNQTDVSVNFSRSVILRGQNTLDKFFTFRFGMKPYQVGKGKPSQTKEAVSRKEFNADSKVSEEHLPLLYAGDVKRYFLSWKGEWVRYGIHLAEPRSLDLFTGSRILVRRIVSNDRLDGTYTDEPFICNTDVITLQPKNIIETFPNIYFFLGILLSLPCATFLKSQNVNLDRAAFPKINTKTLATFPIPSLDPNEPDEKKLHDTLSSLAQEMLKLHFKRSKAITAHERTLLQRQIDSSDRQIDQLVYQLYGLTPEEIALVEGQTG